MFSMVALCRLDGVCVKGGGACAGEGMDVTDLIVALIVDLDIGYVTSKISYLSY